SWSRGLRFNPNKRPPMMAGPDRACSEVTFGVKNNSNPLPMCCFTRPVQSVSSTRIFARMGNEGRQFLAYSMNYLAKEDLAMVLPIPIAPGTGEAGVKFISLEAYPELF